LELLRERIQPGIDTASLDEAASELIERSGGIPALRATRCPVVQFLFRALCASL
jgi:methionyl aminopeptidase